MRFKIEESDAEKELKMELNDLFDEEKRELMDWESSYYYYFSLIDRGGIVALAGDSPEDIWGIPREEADHLIKNNVLGVHKLEGNRIILYDNFNALLSEVSEHPVGLELYLELWEKGYQEKDMPLLMSEILPTYDALKKVYKDDDKEVLFAKAITLTCRGERLQCPTDMRDYFKKAGGLKAVQKAAKKIGKSLRYDSEKRMKAFLRKLQLTFNLDSNFSRTFLEFWRDDKNRVATAAYISGLTHYTSRIVGKPLETYDIAVELGVSNTTVTGKSKKIHMDQRSLKRDELGKISKEFKNQFGVAVTSDDRWEFRWPLEHEKNVYRLKAVEFLLKNKHNENNPIYGWDLSSELEFDRSLYAAINGSPLDPISLGIIQEKDDNYFIKNEDRQRVETYVKLMQRLVLIGQVLNY